MCVCVYMHALHIEKTTNRVCDGMNKRRAHMTLNIAYLHYTLLHENVHTAYIDTHTYSVYVCVCVCVSVSVRTCTAPYRTNKRW